MFNFSCSGKTPDTVSWMDGDTVHESPVMSATITHNCCKDCELLSIMGGEWVFDTTDDCSSAGVVVKFCPFCGVRL